MTLTRPVSASSERCIGTPGDYTSFKVIDLGLRLKDIDGLVSEEVAIERGAAENLRKNGATEKEMRGYYRVSGSSLTHLPATN